MRGFVWWQKLDEDEGWILEKSSELGRDIIRDSSGCGQFRFDSLGTQINSLIPFGLKAGSPGQRGAKGYRRLG